MKRLIIILALGFVACTQQKQSALPYFNTPDFTPMFLTPDAAEKEITHTIPSFSFTNHLGANVTRQDVTGKILIADFFFTRCTSICPRMTGNMQKVAAVVGSDTGVVILSHTVTPDRDSVSALKQYAEKHRINYPNWHLLTGDKNEIYTIARKGYFADERMGFSADTTEFLHTENFVLVDRKGRIRGVYNGTLEVEVENLIRHIRLLNEEN